MMEAQMLNDDFDEEEEEEEEMEENEEEDDEEESLPLRCFLCAESLPGLRPVVEHMRAAHGFDLPSHVGRLGVRDEHEFIRLLNFLRAEAAGSGQRLSERLASRVWSGDDRLLLPVDREDAFLTVDLEELLELRTDGGPSGDESGPARTDDRLRRAEAKAEAAEAALEESRRQLAAMRSCMRRVVLGEDTEGQPPDTADASDSEPPPLMDGPAAPALPNGPVLMVSRSGGGGPVLGDAYFESYDRPGIHEEMLLDRVRTGAYLDFVTGNAARLFAGKRVLDLGCGSGILAMAAARAGAARVVAVDRSSIVFTAMEIARDNGLAEAIEFHHGRLEDLYHELGQIDIVVSEWMGYFLLFESMLDSVLFARERLTPRPRLYPRFFSLHLVGLHDPQLSAEKVHGWDDFYGFRMGALRRQLLAEAVVRTTPPEAVATAPCELLSLDVHDCGLDWTLTDAAVQLRVTGAVPALTAVAGYFDVDFEAHELCDSPVQFSTGPLSPPTHWKQTVFVLREALPVQQGELVSGRISIRRCQDDMRALSVDLTLTNAAGTAIRQRFTMD